MVSPLRGFLIFTASTLAALLLFYYFADLWAVRALGVLLVAWSLWVAYRMMKLDALYTKAFGLSTDARASHRKLLGLVRLHAESAEDRVMFAMASQTILIFLLGLATAQWWWIAVAAVLATFPGFRALRRSWPGYVLVLGASNEPSARTVTRLAQFIFRPLPVTNLLAMVTHDEVDDELFRASSYRLQNEFVSWRSAVEIHAVFARLIVMDMTLLTEATRDEVAIVSGSAFWYKTIFLCPTDQCREAVASIVSSRPEALIVNSRDELKSALLAIRSSLPVTPTLERTVKFLCHAMHGQAAR